MSLPIVLRNEAQAEFDEAFDFYEARQTGLGIDFVVRVQRVFDRIESNPLLHRVVLGDIRKAVVSLFPFWLRGGLCLPVELEATYQRTCIEQRVQPAA